MNHSAAAEAGNPDRAPGPGPGAAGAWLQPRSWWRGQGRVNQVRWYVKSSMWLLLAAFCLGQPIIGLISDWHTRPQYRWTWAGMGAWALLILVLGVLLYEASAVLGSPRAPWRGRWRQLAWALGLLWAVAVTVTAAGALFSRPAVHQFGGLMAWVAATALVCAFTPFLRSARNLAIAAIAVVTCAILPMSGTQIVMLGLTLVLVHYAMVSCVWLVRLTEELDQARHSEAALQVAEERLRFSRDLHDVVGRTLATVAVKSDLAALLAERGDTARAVAEMREVHGLAAESMEEMRTVVRGYRGSDIDREVIGARSLLRSSGTQLEMVGSPQLTPTVAREAASWVVREGVTNLVRHADARAASIEFSRSQLRLLNDGVAVPATSSAP